MTFEEYQRIKQEREERRHALRSNIERGTFRLVLERNISGAHTARPLRKIGDQR